MPGESSQPSDIHPGARHILEQAKTAWQEELSYADTLRDRRKLFTASLALVTGLGLFQFQPYIAADAQFAVTWMTVRLATLAMVALAMVALFMGAFKMFTSGPTTDAELLVLEEGFGFDLDKHPNRRKIRVPRASRLLQLDLASEQALLAATDNLTAAVIRKQRYDLSTRLLVVSNRRVSNRMRAAFVWLGLGYILITLAIVTHTGFAYATPRQHTARPKAETSTANQSARDLDREGATRE